MTFFLDTNICIYALKGTYPSIEEQIRKTGPEPIRIPSIVRAELRFGSCKSEDPENTRDRIERFLFPFQLIPFDGPAVDAYAEIRFQLETDGHPIGPNDLMIAATTRSRSGVLITHNTREFNRVDDLEVRDWTEQSS